MSHEEPETIDLTIPTLRREPTPYDHYECGERIAQLEVDGGAPADDRAAAALRDASPAPPLDPRDRARARQDGGLGEVEPLPRAPGPAGAASRSLHCPDSMGDRRALRGRPGEPLALWQRPQAPPAAAHDLRASHSSTRAAATACPGDCCCPRGAPAPSRSCCFSTASAARRKRPIWTRPRPSGCAVARPWRRSTSRSTARARAASIASRLGVPGGGPGARSRSRCCARR